MRVDERSLNDPVSSSSSRAAESQRIQLDTSSSSSSVGGAPPDRVDLSGLAGRISQTMQALSSQSMQRVNQLQKDFRGGRYQPDASQIARAMAG